MAKQLWKFLEDGGIDACLEYGEIYEIREQSNCCSWAIGDLLHYYDGAVPYNCRIGIYNAKSIRQITHRYMTTRFTADFIANGAIFMGLGEKMPTAPKGHYLAVAFYNPTPGGMDFHFMRGHRNGTWTERNGAGRKVGVVAESVKSIRDLMEEIGNYYMFKGWFAIPNRGLQGGVDQAVVQVCKSLTAKQKASIPQALAKDIKKLTEFYMEKNHLLNNVINLDILQNNFRSLANNFGLNDSSEIIKFLEKHNQVQLRQIKNSPQRDLRRLVR